MSVHVLKNPFWGLFIFYATNEREALSEAKHVLRLVKDYQMAYPVYYDLEDNNTTGRQSNQTIANIAQTFAQKTRTRRLLCRNVCIIVLV